MQNINIATCSINQWAMDFENNEKNIINCINDAKQKGADLILLPELVTCGYSCQDHFLERETYELSMNIIRNITEDKELSKDTLIVIGSPILLDDVKYNTMIFILNNKIIFIRPKIILSTDGNYREGRFFNSWTKKELHEYILKDFKNQKIAPIGNAIINLNGIKIAAEVCKELWSPNPLSIELYMNGAHIILNSSGSHFELNKINKRIDLIRSVTKRCGGAYIYSNSIGCDGDRLYFDGGSIISLNGKITDIEERFILNNYNILIKNININDITTFRIKESSIQILSSKINKNFNEIKCEFLNKNKLSISNFNNVNKNINNKINIKNNDKNIDISSLLINHNKKIVDRVLNDFKNISNNDIYKIINASSCWLFDYLRKSKSTQLILLLNNDEDSTSVCLIVYNMCKLIEKNYEKIKKEKFTKELFKSLNINKNNHNANLIFEKILKCVYLEDNNDYHNDYLKKISYNLIKLLSNNENPKNWKFFSTNSLLNYTEKILSEQLSNTEKINVKKNKKYIRSKLSTFFLYSLSNIYKSDNYLLTLASSNSDELLVGNYKNYDTSIGDINLIGSLPKIYINKILMYYGLLFPNLKNNPILEILFFNYENKYNNLNNILYIEQENIGISYSQIEFIGNLRSYGYGMIDVYNKAKKSKLFKNKNDAKNKIELFYKLYSINRNKATISTPCVHLLPNSDDNRFDLRQILYPKSTKQLDIIKNL